MRHPLFPDEVGLTVSVLHTLWSCLMNSLSRTARAVISERLARLARPLAFVVGVADGFPGGSVFTGSHRFSRRRPTRANFASLGPINTGSIQITEPSGNVTPP